MKKPNGYVLHETDDIVIIATGFETKSDNAKTGAMIQIYSLLRNVDPITGSKTGQDEKICFSCPARGDGDGTGRYCYVTLMHGPSAVYRAYKNGSYPRLTIDRMPVLFSGRNVRLGAYGETVLIPQMIVETICSVARKHTGYTHQWRNEDCAWIRPFVMASCETPEDYAAAVKMGWRTYRTAPKFAWSPLAGEILCPASEEAGHKTECSRCGLCNGAGTAKNLFIPVHGSQAKNALVVLQ